MKGANKAINDDIRRNELVSSRLVFVMLLRFPLLNSNLPSQKRRMDIIKTAQAEVKSIIAERKATAALTKNVPFSANRNYKPSDEVLICDERSQQWKWRTSYCSTKTEL